MGCSMTWMFMMISASFPCELHKRFGFMDQLALCLFEEIVIVLKEFLIGFIGIQHGCPKCQKKQYN
jgi:hypothetical protein